MNLVELIVVVCSILSQNVCSEKHFVFESQGSLSNCMMEAQPHLAQWAGGHPNERIARWRCAWPDQEGRSL